MFSVKGKYIKSVNKSANTKSKQITVNSITSEGELSEQETHKWYE